MVQKPASVVQTTADAPTLSESAEGIPVAPVPPQNKEVRHSTSPAVAAPIKSLGIADLAQMARGAAKSPASAKKYAGETLRGQAKFVKTPKGNPNAVVADVRVSGLGEVSLWCRNVLGAAPAGRVTAFEGTLTGSVYTSEDFSHDVTMKDCRFHE